MASLPTGQVAGASISALGVVGPRLLLSDSSSYVNSHVSRWWGQSWATVFLKNGAVQGRRTLATGAPLQAETPIATSAIGATTQLDAAPLGDALLSVFTTSAGGLDVWGALQLDDGGVSTFPITSAAGADVDPAINAGTTVVGERWGLLVVRELLSGPRRFSDLLAGMPGVATNTLTSRLEELEHHGLITRQQLPPPAASAVYELTERGRGLEKAVVELVRWAAPEVARAGRERRRLAPLRASWLALALKAFFVPSQAKRVSGQLVFRLPTGALMIEVKNSALELRDAAPGDLPLAMLRCSEDQVLELVLESTSLEALLKGPGVELQGDAKAISRFLAVFKRKKRAA